MFRLILILVAVYLAARYLLKIFRAPRPDDKIKGEPKSKSAKVNREQIQDANFKDLPDNET